MQKNIFQILVITLGLLFFQNVHAKVTVTGTVDAAEVGVGDTTEFLVRVVTTEDEDVQPPRLPSLDGFELINKRDFRSQSSKLVVTSQGMQHESTQTNEFVYTLVVTKKGSLTIPAVEVIVAGKQYYTKPIVIRGVDAGQAARPQNRGGSAQPFGGGFNPPDGNALDEAEELFNAMMQRRGGQFIPTERSLPKNPNEAFTVQVEVDKKEVFEGEQVLVNWYLFTRGRVIALDRLKFPDLRGFWKEIIEEVPSLNFVQEVVNGVPYQKALLASHALFPIKPGESKIDSYRVKATVQLPQSQFGAFTLAKPYTFTKASQEIKIKVKPLPVEGRPGDFSGAVGDFEINSYVDSNQVPANQPFSLRIRFEGQGNAKLIELPALNLPPEFEVFETKSDSKFFKNGKSFKEFEVVLIPRKDGVLKIPSFSISLFDPVKAQYVTKKTSEIDMNVTPSESAVSQTKSESFLGSAKEPTVVVEKIDGPPSLVLTEVTPSFIEANRQIVWPTIYGLLILMLGLKSFFSLRQSNVRPDIEKKVRPKLKKIKNFYAAGNFRSFAAESVNVIYILMGASVPEGQSGVDIGALLKNLSPSLQNELGPTIKDLLTKLEILAFAPEEIAKDLSSKDSLSKIYDQFRKVSDKLIKNQNLN